jgi:hypothetical protein
MTHPSQLPLTSGDFRHIKPCAVDIPYWTLDGDLDTVRVDGFAVYHGDVLVGRAFAPEGAVQLLRFSPSPDRRGQGSTAATGGEPPVSADGQAPPQVYDSPMAGILLAMSLGGVMWIGAALAWWWLG